ncbi:tyrosine-type recombinase/integrase [Aquabacterium sp.]|uniref:tyrosine-type recombinase/integrase n=1 Tax=Aquabacterium sp. TaxID=1872578 RepID=UPI0025BA676D|nr:tyrosine-type recombinase/integrase [Aquabacterium sp.]
MAEKHWTDQAAIDAWLEWLEGTRGRSKRTVEAYGMAVRRLHEYLQQEGVALLDVDAGQLELFSGLYLHKKGVVARSRIPYISALRGFFAFAQARRMVARNPAAKLSHPKTGMPLPRTISLANAERLMWAPDMGTFIGIRDAAMLALLIGCGPRVSGLVALNESSLRPIQVGNEARLAVVFREKGQKERMLPVPKEADMLLRVYLGHEELKAIDRDIMVKDGQGTHPDRVLFVSVRSTILRPDEHRGEKRRLTRKAVHDMVQRYGRRLGIPLEELHPHAFRHLFGTELTEDDVSLASTQDLMGHADPKSTSIYIRLAQRRKAKLIDQNAPLAKMRTPVSELLKRLPPG